MPKTKTRQESDDATYVKHIGLIENIMENPELIEHMGQQYLQDYIKMGVKKATLQESYM
jgi:hypothetical protein